MIKNSHLDKSDKRIVGATILIGFLLFSWLVYDIAFLNPSIEGQIEIGKIYSTTNKVKRKFNRSLIWYEAGNDDTVYQNDWIFTGSQSIAKIKLKAGGEIIVEPDSMLVLSQKNGVLELNLQHGRMMADVKSKNVKINVIRNGNKETIDTGKGIVSIAQKDFSTNNQPQIADVNLDNDGDGKKDQSLSDFADQKHYEPSLGFDKLDDSFLSLQKNVRSSAKIYPGQSTQTAFLWKDPFDKWASYAIQISEDENFVSITSQSNTQAGQFVLISKQPAHYFWRARGLDEAGNPGPWSKHQKAVVDIEFIEKTAPLKLAQEEIVYPMSLSDLDNLNSDRSHDLPEESPLSIAWSTLDNAENYKVQVSDVEDFSNIIEEKITKSNRMDLSNIRLGKTYFRVVPETKEGFPMAKEATGFVSTLYPAPHSTSLQTVATEDELNMKWNKVPYAEAYEVRYRKDRNAIEDTVEVVSQNNLSVQKDSRYLQWNVRVVDPGTRQPIGKSSKTVDWYEEAKRLASVEVEKDLGGQTLGIYPKITKPETRKTYISVNKSPLFIVMNWVYEKDVPNYEVEISAKPDMSQLVFHRRVQGMRTVVNQQFKPGIYYMRVRALSQDVAQEAWSETEVFRVINRDAR